MKLVSHQGGILPTEVPDDCAEAAAAAVASFNGSARVGAELSAFSTSATPADATRRRKRGERERAGQSEQQRSRLQTAGGWGPEAANWLPSSSLRVGFTDLGCEPGSDAASFGQETMQRWGRDMFARLSAHADRCRRAAEAHAADEAHEEPGHADSHGAGPAAKSGPPGGQPGGQPGGLPGGGASTGDGSSDASGVVSESGEVIPSSACGAESSGPHPPLPPRIVAFTGARQWTQLFDPALKRADFGLQSIRPPGWPFPASADAEVYVLPSSSGRAVFQADARLRPYAELGARLREIRKGEKEIKKMGL
mmetsp:Transcript_21981/g.49703  ORF Transcript_21981/g.49703 Transcript_21981/m.49703 type:complete len:309 (+) Transcript_21981:730-1656(+)